ncbi:MAG: hypothetical protein LBE35_03505 [Clostridiales bacterium]|jgi:hypothetical protein|nr:hypothetical protein [Clostridiales bacterium]
MPNIMELRVEQKSRLYQLLVVKKDLERNDVSRLDEFIRLSVVEMDKEDVSWVKEQVENA